jgi:glycosyltransferase involved in cell wall biosynthesis
MPKKFSVLVLTTSFPIDSSIAVGIHIIEKCRHLVKNGVKVKVLAPHHAGSKTSERIDGISVKRFRYFFPTRWQKVAYGAGIPTNLKNSRLAKCQLPIFMLAFFLSTISNTRNVDIIHCHWSVAGLIGIIAGKLFNKKVVLMVHGAEVFVLGKHPVLKFVLKHVDCTISNSSFTEQETHKVYPSKKSVVIPPGVDVNRFYSQARIANLRHRLNLSSGDVFVLSIGKFIPRKGFEYLIEAFNQIVHQRNIKDIKLRIGGRGPLKSHYEQMIDQYCLSDHIGFLGYIKDEDIPSYYTEADIFVLPSIVDERGDTEGLGVVFLEANACGTPVIGSRVGGIIDVIKNGVNGFYVRQKNALDLAEKIIKLADNEELRKKMGAAGRRIVEEDFNWNHLTKRIIKIYDSLLI